MAKEYEIFSEADFMDMVAKFGHHFQLQKEKGLPFQKIKVIAKRWQKPKSSRQHRAYWRCIGELKKAFIANGYDTNEQECHEFAKKKAGFTKMIGDIMVTKSISDLSEDATSPEMNRLIETIQRFASEELGTLINIGDDVGGF